MRCRRAPGVEAAYTRGGPCGSSPAGVALALLAAAAAGGCGLSDLRPGMRQAEVECLLGAPDRVVMEEGSIRWLYDGESSGPDGDPTTGVVDVAVFDEAGALIDTYRSFRSGCLFWRDRPATFEPEGGAPALTR